MSIDAQVVTERIAAPVDTVYEFARQPENLPRWASGLAAGIEEEGGSWFAASPMGRVKIAMAPPNGHGVLDHDVTLPDGTTVHNAFRVTPAGDHSVLTFVVLHLEGVTPEVFRQDVAHVARDLRALKALLEPAAR